LKTFLQLQKMPELEMDFNDDIQF